MARLWHTGGNVRYARIKFEIGRDGFVHVYNRTVGSSGEFPFGEMEKAELLRRIRDLDQYYAVEVLVAVAMGNHFHAILYVPTDSPGAEETVERYHRRYPHRRKLRPGSKRCQRLALKLRDLSEFTKELQQPFTRWFNRTRTRRRRGHLWADRFKSTVLESGLAVWDCWKYIEMNPVPARMVNAPADYRFGSFGQWTATGRHPFSRALCSHLLPSLRDLLHVGTLDEVKVALRKEFARMKAVDERGTEQQIDTAIATAAEKEPFSTRTDRRVRYWVDGLVIGSRQYVRETMLRARSAAALKRRRFARAVSASGDPVPLCCFKQLRVLLE